MELPGQVRWVQKPSGLTGVCGPDQDGRAFGGRMAEAAPRRWIRAEGHMRGEEWACWPRPLNGTGKEGWYQRDRGGLEA